MKKLCVGLTLVALSLLLTSVAVAAEELPPLVSYSVPGQPQHVAVESPGRLWFTMPDVDLVGLLVVTTTVDYKVTTYPSTIAEPYAIDVAGGQIWFTALEANAIGRLDPVSGAVDVFPIPTDDSQPVALDVLPGTPDRVWFAERSGGALGQLVVTSTVDYAITEYPLPVAKFGSDPQVNDLDVVSSDRVWFAAPGAHAIGSFRPSYWPWSSSAFTPVSDPSGITPWSISVDQQGAPWFTDVSGKQLGKFFPQTIALFDFYPVSASDADLYDVVAVGGSIWYSDRAGRVGRLVMGSRSIKTYSKPGSRPLGMAADENGSIWIADGALNQILEWRAPYFYRVFLPVLAKYSD